jgi:hypothetical protein
MASKTMRTMRGQLQGIGNLKRELLLDDGLINQGYRITSFIVWSGVRDDNFCQATLSSKPKVAGSDQNASINTEIAWATYGTVTGPLTAGAVYHDRIIDEDHIINRDLYITMISTSGNSDQTWNYLITMESRKLSSDEAILAIIREEAQNVGA